MWTLNKYYTADLSCPYIKGNMAQVKINASGLDHPSEKAERGFEQQQMFMKLIGSFLWLSSPQGTKLQE